MTLQAKEKMIRMFKWLGISVATAIISFVLGMAIKGAPIIGIILGSLLVASLVLATFLYLAACEALAKAKGYNPVIIATMLLGGLAAIIPPLAIGVFTPLILLAVLPDISGPPKA